MIGITAVYRHDSWDARYLDVDYSPVYERQRYVVVQGVFLHRIIDVLELGKSEYITDPISFAWGLIDFVLTSKPSSCETESSVDEENSLLALRTLHLLMLRYDADDTIIVSRTDYMCSLCSLFNALP